MFIASAKEDMFVVMYVYLFVSLLVCKIAEKVMDRFWINFPETAANGKKNRLAAGIFW